MRIVRVTWGAWLAGAAIALTLGAGACTLNPQPLPPEAPGADGGFGLAGDAGDVRAADASSGVDSGTTLPDASVGGEGGNDADGGPPAVDGGDGDGGTDASDDADHDGGG